MEYTLTVILLAKTGDEMPSDTIPDGFPANNKSEYGYFFWFNRFEATTDFQ